ncbi:efflux transporter outer membrane subunit [Sabulibacter ruber]|uniref:efflux transporter outer membrane subunit n=1 Tax=Sabulibacter ruber TaxID=2811901 RepID=UPI001A95AD5D|nr:efflux transporter outer membrane subunit [Sabulibacter ruber]
MTYKITNLNYILGVLVLALLGACTVGNQAQLPTPAPIPASFSESGPKADSAAAVGKVQWRAYFTDAYLVSLIDSALQHNPDALAAVQQVEMARSEVTYTRGLLRPQLQAVASAGVDRYGDYTMDGVGNYDTNFSPNINGKRRIPEPAVPDFFLGLRSSWEIDLWGKLRNYRKAAYGRYLASEEGRKLVVTSLVADVAHLYYELLALNSELEILDKNIDLQEKAVELSQLQKTAGRTTELGVQQFTAQLLNTQSLRTAKRQEIVAVQNHLNQLLGRYPQEIGGGKTISGQRIPEQIAVGLPSQMLLQRPDIRQSELLLEASKADVAAARKAFLPSLGLSPYVGLNAFKASLLFSAPASVAYGIVGGLSAPLLNRSGLKAQLSRSEVQKLQAFYAYQKAVQTGFREVMTNLRAFENFSSVSQTKAKEVEVLRNAVSTSNELYRAGYASYLEIITAQRSVLEAELDLVNTQKLVLQSTVHLYRSLGGGWQ